MYNMEIRLFTIVKASVVIQGFMVDLMKNLFCLISQLGMRLDQLDKLKNDLILCNNLVEVPHFVWNIVKIHLLPMKF